MGAIITTIGSIITKGSLGPMLANLGMFSAGLAVLATALKWLLPSPFVLVIVLMTIACFVVAMWFAIDRMQARMARRDIEVAQAQANASKS